MNDAPPPERPPLGLCLLGGGVTGAMYSVGVLAALEEHVPDFDATACHAYVGAGTGAVLAVGLAGGLEARRLYRALLNPADDLFPMTRQHVLRFERRELQRALKTLGAASLRLLGSVARPGEVDLWHALDRFTDALPAGVLTTDAFTEFLAEVFERRGIPTHLDGFARPVRIVANDLDHGSRVVLGDEALPHVATANALGAACAAPVLFAPARVAGRDLIAGNSGEFGHADVAASLGCAHVLVLHPEVPIRTEHASDRPAGIRHRGLLWVYSQAWRMVAEARLLRGLDAFRLAHPETQVHLIEPERDDTLMFMHSPMNFAARREILEDGYRRTTLALRDPESELSRALAAAALTPAH